MRHKKQRHHHHDTSHSMSIPELRKSFEHIENFTQEKIASGHLSKHELVESFREEWKKTFYKEIDSENAEAYVDHLTAYTVKDYSHKSKFRHTRKSRHKTKGGAMPLAGAPLDYMTRPGEYVGPTIPPNTNLHIPNYVASGFVNPEPAILQSHDKYSYPTHTPADMGSNRVSGGANIRSLRRKTRKQGGMAPLTQLMNKPYISSNPPGVIQDMYDAWNGKQLGQSPDPVQTLHSYKL